ncbi:hypothetical protein ACS0TY_018611 [Phlomoides rotata]
MRWIQSVLFFAGYDIRGFPEVLTSRIPTSRRYYKAKSDYVKEPISKTWFKGIWKLLYEKEADEAQLILTPYGGRISEISESAIPYPHRAGNLYKIQHLVYWDEPGRDASTRLARIKSVVDPSNFFRNEQSIPSLAFSEASEKARE